MSCNEAFGNLSLFPSSCWVGVCVYFGVLKKSFVDTELALGGSLSLNEEVYLLHHYGILFCSYNFGILCWDETKEHCWAFSSVQSLSRVRLFETPETAACQASLSITNSWSLLKPMSIESVMPASHLILWRPLLLLPSIFPSIRVFSNESALRIRWPKYWSLSFSISPSTEHPGLISFRMDWLRSLKLLELMVLSLPLPQQLNYFLLPAAYFLLTNSFLLPASPKAADRFQKGREVFMARLEQLKHFLFFFFVCCWYCCLCLSFVPNTGISWTGSEKLHNAVWIQWR